MVVVMVVVMVVIHSLCDCGRSVYFLNFCHDHGI